MLPPTAIAAGETDKAYMGWINAMKRAERGPFSGIRWFCEDGAVLPAKPYPCESRGGGVQHGLWSERTRQLRDAGYRIANVLVDVDTAEFFSRDDWRKQLAQVLLERFLIDYDDGWIFRGARSYRGALQTEDEVKGAQDLLSGLFIQADRGNQDFLLIREAYRLLPREVDAGSAAKVRNLATKIAAKDPNFAAIRTKIHNQPDSGDAKRVRDYARARGRADSDYEALAGAIEELHAGSADLSRKLSEMVEHLHPDLLQAAVQQAKNTFEREKNPAARLKLAADLMRKLRDAFPLFKYDATRRATLDLSLALEQEVFSSGNALRDDWPKHRRESLMEYLSVLGDSLYGSGLISQRELQGVEQSVKRLSKPQVAMAVYRNELRYLNRLPSWANRWLRFHFAAAEKKLSTIEPITTRFVPDRLRGSPMLVYSAIMDVLLKDANVLSGVRYDLFGHMLGSGVRPLNPGLARGILAMPAADAIAATAGQIVVAQETTAELPPVAGILTLGEGNSLSHVQLLAANMGIPNLVIEQNLLPLFKQNVGKNVALAVSPGGTVRLELDGPEWDAVFGSQEAPDDRIEADLGKLDLQRRDFVPLADLRAADAGRIAGPKAANLGELKSAFPKAVVDGLVIPFGAFRELLDQSYGNSGQTVFAWMRGQYQAINAMPATDRPVATERFLRQLRQWILAAEPGPAFRTGLKKKLSELFGKDGSYALYVRSDTNMEDLPGFTGAGLNLTVPNVRGFDTIMQAIKRVWASPFSERAYAWRQQRMTGPENVYPSVLLMPGVGVDKSGVLLTLDNETGKPDGLTIAVNHGVGGAVQGQSAEEISVGADGSVRLLADATDPMMRVLDESGGLREQRAAASGKVLEANEIRHLVSFARELEVRFPQTDAEGKPAAADVEFGFRNGELVLFQVRPFLQNQRVRKNQFLNALDQPAAGQVNMRAKPE